MADMFDLVSLYSSTNEITWKTVSEAEAYLGESGTFRSRLYTIDSLFSIKV